MRIVLLSHYYEPEIGAPQRRWKTLVEGFVRRGHEVAVCAPVAHYPHRRAADLPQIRRTDLWRWADGDRGERILRVPYVPLSGNLPGQLVDQTVSSAAMLGAMLPLRRSRPDVVVSTTPGLPMPFTGAAAARALRVPHVAEVRDAWPDLIADSALVKRATGRLFPEHMTKMFEQRALPATFDAALRRADAVVTTTEGFAARLRDRGMHRVVSIRNTSDPVAATRPARTADDELRILYVGTVGRSQGLETVVRAVSRVPGTRLRIVGAGAEWSSLRALAGRLTDRIEFLPQTTGARLDAHWAWAHTGLVSLADVSAYKVTVPSKLVSVMARRMHVTGVLAGEAAEIVRSAAAGSVSPPGDEGALVALLARLRDDPIATHLDDRPVTWLEAQASPRAAVETYLRLLEDVVA